MSLEDVLRTARIAETGGVSMKSISLLVTAVLLAGCTATMPQDRRPTAADDPSGRCFEALDIDARFTSLLPKVGSVAKTGAASLEALASKEKASEEDKRVISILAVARQTCADAGRQFRAQHAPPGWAAAFDAGQQESLALFARLYAQELTYGEFNRARLEAANRTRTALNQSSAAAQQAEANERSAAVQALQTQQLIQSMQPRPAPVPVYTPPPAPIRCTSNRIGNQTYTSCY